MYNAAAEQPILVTLIYAIGIISPHRQHRKRWVNKVDNTPELRCSTTVVYHSDC